MLMMPTKKVLASARSFLHFIWDTLYCTDWRPYVDPTNHPESSFVPTRATPSPMLWTWFFLWSPWHARLPGSKPRPLGVQDNLPQIIPLNLVPLPLGSHNPRAPTTPPHPRPLSPKEKMKKVQVLGVVLSVFLFRVRATVPLIRRLKECYPTLYLDSSSKR